jgi:hypothetical protein
MGLLYNISLNMDISYLYFLISIAILSKQFYEMYPEDDDINTKKMDMVIELDSYPFKKTRYEFSMTTIDEDNDMWSLYWKTNKKTKNFFERLVQNIKIFYNYPDPIITKKTAIKSVIILKINTETMSLQVNTGSFTIVSVLRDSGEMKTTQTMELGGVSEDDVLSL